MGTEIERKYLVINDGWRKEASAGIHYVQGYFTTNNLCSIRVRIAGNRADLNIKSATIGIFRTEYNYPIPAKDAEEMLKNLCIHPAIEKTRYHVKHNQHTWEIDVFTGENEGLVIAEIELCSIDELFSKPDWTGDEVSNQPRYYNVCLVKHSYKKW